MSPWSLPTQQTSEWWVCQIYQHKKHQNDESVKSTNTTNIRIMSPWSLPTQQTSDESVRSTNTKDIRGVSEVYEHNIRTRQYKAHHTVTTRQYKARLTVWPHDSTRHTTQWPHDSTRHTTQCDYTTVQGTPHNVTTRLRLNATQTTDRGQGGPDD